MAICPFCTGSIPDDAPKCKHCGEWVVPRPAEVPGPGDGVRMLGEAAKTGVNFYIVMSVIGLLIGLGFFLFFWLPQWNKMEKRHDEFHKQFEQKRKQFDEDWEKTRQRHEDFDKRFDAQWGR